MHDDFVDPTKMCIHLGCVDESPNGNVYTHTHRIRGKRDLQIQGFVDDPWICGWASQWKCLYTCTWDPWQKRPTNPWICGWSLDMWMSVPMEICVHIHMGKETYKSKDLWMILAFVDERPNGNLYMRFVFAEEDLESWSTKTGLLHVRKVKPDFPSKVRFSKGHVRDFAKQTCQNVEIWNYLRLSCFVFKTTLENNIKFPCFQSQIRRKSRTL